MVLRIASFFIFVLALSSCNVLFSPTVNLPPKPLQKEEVSLSAGAGNFPSFGTFGNGAQLAAEAEAGYGFSDDFTLRLKSWNDFGFLNNRSTLWGGTTSAIIMLNRAASEYRFALIPVAGFTADDDEITAGGFELHFGVWTPDFYFIRPRFSIGTIYGTRNLANDDWGIGGSANLALSADITDYLYVNLESYFISIYRNPYNSFDYFGGVVLGLGFYL